MRKRMHRDTAKARVEHAIDAMAPGVAEQLAGKAKAAIGKGEKLLGEITDHPDIARAGRKLAAEGKVEEIVGGVKAATADAAEHVKAAGERISEKLKGEAQREEHP